MKILVTGGAGYIGSFMVRRLLENGDDVVILDSMYRGNRDALDLQAKIYEGNLLDKEFVKKVFSENRFDAVFHFAALALAGESMQKPGEYFENNIAGGINLLDEMRGKVDKLIFSSSCSIYGSPSKIPVTEQESKKPESVYGETKLMFEKIIDWYDKLYDIKHINLRYFNASGAALDGSLGENHDPETHIIPVAIESVLSSKPFKLFGRDYSTKDGSCIRDYIHVLDLAEAHLLALKNLEETKKSDSFNLGSGVGYSNLEILKTIEDVSGVKITIEDEARREGDPPMVFADNSKAKNELGFSPKHSDLETIVKSAWQWHKKRA